MFGVEMKSNCVVRWFCFFLILIKGGTAVRQIDGLIEREREREREREEREKLRKRKKNIFLVTKGEVLAK